ncbi:MAG: hypothetical protein U1F43_34625 [Myxococcota bacterium]
MTPTPIRLAALLSLALTGALTTSCKPPNDASNDTPNPGIPTEGCQPWDCGGFIDDTQTLCPDGVTMSGATGNCIAHGSVCAWEVISCPETPECELDDCGQRSTAPNYLCADNTTIAGPTGRCLAHGSTCAWEITKCPAGKDLCPIEACGELPALPNWMCPDGTTVAGPSGDCVKQTNGVCAWEIVKCPANVTSIPH